jgi:hypothetical protein
MMGQVFQEWLSVIGKCLAKSKRIFRDTMRVKMFKPMYAFGK